MDLTSAQVNGTAKDSFTKAQTCSFLCWGCGEFGQHCHGHNNDVSFRQAEVAQFASMTAPGVISSISCGGTHTVVVTDSGEVLAWGNGNSGQLGCGDQDNRWKPTVITLSPPPPKGVRVRTSACGNRHTLLLLENGHIYSFGNNFYAQLGYNFRQDNYKDNQIRPQLLEFLKHRPVRQVACGDKHSLFLFQTGALAAVGNNAIGQLGDGSRGESTVPKAVELGRTVTQIACGPNHNLAITDAGDVYAWGYGKACGKRCHDVMSPEFVDFKGRRVVQVSGGSTHSLFLTAGGKVYAWGFGMDGQLGLDNIVMATKPRQIRHSFLEEGASCVACGDAFSAVVTVSGRLYMWGKNSHTIEEGKGSHHRVTEPRCMNPPPSPPVRNVVCGAWHAAALTGLPGFVTVPEDSDKELSDKETSSKLSDEKTGCRLSDEDTGCRLSDEREPSVAVLRTASGEDPCGPTVDPGAGDSEISSPPSATASKPPAKGLEPAMALCRNKTKLSIGEFYSTPDVWLSVTNTCMTSSSPTSEPSPTAADAKQSQVSTCKTISSEAAGQSKIVPLIVEMPSASLDPESDVEEPLSVSMADEVLIPNHRAVSDALPRLRQPKESDEAVVKKAATCSSGSESSPPGSEPSKLKADCLPAIVVGLDVAGPSTEGLRPRQERDGTGARGGLEGAKIKVRKGVTGGIRRGGTSCAGEQSLLGPRSQTTFVSNARVPVHMCGASSKNLAFRRQRSVAISRNLDILDASQLFTGASGFSSAGHAGQSCAEKIAMENYLQKDLGKLDLAYLESSPKKELVKQHVPTYQFEGNFGALPEPTTFIPEAEEKGSKSALTSRDLDWIHHLLLKKAIGQGSKFMERSSTFFGSLSGQMSRSPTKFFRKPTSSSVLSRTVTTAISGSPTIRPTFTKTPTFIGLKGACGDGKGTAPFSRSATRSLGIAGGGKALAEDAPGLWRGSLSATESVSMSAVPGGQVQSPSGKIPVFSSASSWRQRTLDFTEELLDINRNQITFAVGSPGAATYNNAVTGLTEVRNGDYSLLNEAAENSLKMQSESQIRSGHIMSTISKDSSTTSSHCSQRLPTSSFRTAGGNKKNPSSRNSSYAAPRTTGLKTMLVGTKPASINSVTGQGHSDARLVVAGYGECSRRAHYD